MVFHGFYMVSFGFSRVFGENPWDFGRFLGISNG